MDKAALCNRHVSDLQSRNSKLSETSAAFIDTPVIPPYSANPMAPASARHINETPITQYVLELSDDTKEPSLLLEELKKYNPKAETLALIEEAVDSMYKMNEAQYHAIYLAQEYTKRKGTNLESALNAIIKDAVPEYTLTVDEKAKTDEELLEAADDCITGETYNGYKSTVSENLRKVLQSINESSTKKQSNLQFNVKMLRGFLWSSILLLFIINIIFVIIIGKSLVLPVVKFAKKIDDNQRLESTSNLYEANRLVNAYNALLDRHMEFENDLKEVAEMDALTGLPNRYCYNEFLKNQTLDGRSVCVFLFDINNLKYVNDTFGHNKGDELIKSASECIKECFLDEEKKNCYRIGGDEFVAILDNIYEEDIEKLLTRFKVQQEVKNVSIAVGYSYSKNVLSIGYEKLIIDADQKMYENKNEMKKNLQEK
ncbi:MAG: GGDEF domain-containing protein [Acholeplasmatales bacterium]|nr:GGDEF domain-containing protein [Acholeplasmatales bacterium]